MAKFIAATFDKPTLTVDYVADDGSHLLRTGGTIAWRFNNPGNIRPAGTNASIRIGIGKTANGEFCIFPSYEVGRRAKKELLRRKYDKHTIPEALEIYAPRSENDTDAYVEHIIKKTGLPRDKPLSEFSDAQLDAMMDAMESKEGFNAKRETRKEKWVHTTQLTLSDGSQPIAGEEVKVDFSGKEYVTKTNVQGAIPPIVHMSDDVSVEISLKNMKGAWDCVYAFVTGKKSRQLLATLDQQIYRGTTRMASTAAKPTSPAAQKPLVYVVQSGDNLTKIANKFKTTVADLRKSNQGIIKENLIFPGQRINVYGFAGEQAAAPVSSTASAANAHPKAAEATKPVSSSKGQPLALVDPAQRKAPWMDVAIREAKQWAGKDESEIKDNYHLLSGSLKSSLATAWCASFVNYCLKDSGSQYELSASSQFPIASKKFRCIDNPVYGALVVLKNYLVNDGSAHGTGHVTFFYGFNRQGKIVALGGNQGNKIKCSVYKASGDSAPFNVGNKKKPVWVVQRLYGYYIPTAYAPVAGDGGVGDDLCDEVEVNRLLIGLAIGRRVSGESTR
jgi:uncharacterized protein (TIGR02594 family)